ncbi:hypothetical protein GGR43_003220 [Sphingobium jiangsuense]|uniref:Uncharacterized protein n=1 Tax=Sphingobium jiangsuense TaxID=870476 RepID=A0A7W6BTC6_9SPHN|nr:hypothetical protein [Sphingobium jiangsuense]
MALLPVAKCSAVIFPSFPQPKQGTAAFVQQERVVADIKMKHDSHSDVMKGK